MYINYSTPSMVCTGTLRTNSQTSGGGARVHYVQIVRPLEGVHANVYAPNSLIYTPRHTSWHLHPVPYPCKSDNPLGSRCWSCGTPPRRHLRGVEARRTRRQRRRPLIGQWTRRRADARRRQR